MPEININEPTQQPSIQEQYDKATALLKEHGIEFVPDAAEVQPGEPVEQTDNVTTPDTSEAPSPYGEQLTTIMSSAGLDPNAIAQEYEQAGEFKPETREALDKAFGKEAVDAYLRGLSTPDAAAKQQAEELEQKILTLYNGVDNWNTVSTWATKNEQGRRIAERYNQHVESGNVAGIELEANNLKQAYERSEGSLNSTSPRSGTPVSTGGEQAYASLAEMQKDMSSEEYKTNPAFRDKVAKRLAASNFYSANS